MADPEAATEALRSLIEAILIYPGERRGEVSISLRGDLAAFLHAAEAAVTNGPAGVPFHLHRKARAG